MWQIPSLKRIRKKYKASIIQCRTFSAPALQMIVDISFYCLASFNSVCYDYSGICFQTNHHTMYLLLAWIANQTKAMPEHTCVRPNGFTAQIAWAYNMPAKLCIQIVLPSFSAITDCPLAITISVESIYHSRNLVRFQTNIAIFEYFPFFALNPKYDFDFCYCCFLYKIISRTYAWLVDCT